MTFVDDAPGHEPVTDVWAWVAVSPDGTEGIVGGSIPTMGWVPFVFGKLDLAEKVGHVCLGTVALQAPDKTFELRRYALAETVEVFER